DLVSHPVLRELDAAASSALAKHLASLVWNAGEQQLLPPGLWLLTGGQAEQTQPPAATLNSGAVLGEASLCLPNAPMPSVRALTACRWAHMSQEAFAELGREHPRVALELVCGLLRQRAGVSGAGGEQVSPYATTLAGIAAPASEARAPATLTVLLSGHELVVPAGTPYHALLSEKHDQALVVAALVDNKATSLNGKLTSSCRLEPLTTRQWEGQRIYRHSLALLALQAAHNVAPTLTVSMGPSVGFGRRILPADLVNSELREFAAELEAEMLQLKSQPLPVHEEHWTVDQARDYFSRHGWLETKQLLDTWREATVPVVSYGDVYALHITPVLTRTILFDNFFVLHDDNLLLLVYGRRSEHILRPTRTMP